MARYRLRFLLQEFDLPRGITIIGRSLDCHLTIEDPLVSRQHARIVIDDEGGSVEDMGSRNGVRVDGVTDPGRHPAGRRDDACASGRRTSSSAASTPAARRTRRRPGSFASAPTAACRTRARLPSCPNCEATEQTDEDTLTAVGPSEGSTRRTRGACSCWSRHSSVPSRSGAFRTPSASSGGPRLRSKRWWPPGVRSTHLPWPRSPPAPPRRPSPRTTRRGRSGCSTSTGGPTRVPPAEVVERLAEVRDASTARWCSEPSLRCWSTSEAARDGLPSGASRPSCGSSRCGACSRRGPPKSRVSRRARATAHASR